MGEQVVASPFREYREEELGGTLVAFIRLSREFFSFFNFFFARRFSEMVKSGCRRTLIHIGFSGFFFSGWGCSVGFGFG